MSRTAANIETGDVTSGSHISLWIDTHIQPDNFNRPEKDISTDVVVVGCGIAGASIAYNLIKSGRKVIVVEDGFPGSGETGRTSAHLTNALDDRFFELEKLFGKDKTPFIAGSHTQAIHFIEHVVKKENIDCEFLRVNGYLFLHTNDKEETLEKEIDALNRAGIDAVMTDQAPSLKNYNGKVIEFRNQAQFHPLKYLGGLCKAIEAHGGIIYTGTKASEITHQHIITDHGIKISADHVVVASNSPVNNKYAMHLKQYAYRTYVIGTLIPRNSIKPALWWDTGDPDSDSEFPPYHYVRTETYNNDFDMLLCGGEDHPTGLPETQDIVEEGRYKRLEEWMREHFNAGAVVYKWSGQIMEPADSLAYIGKNPYDHDNVYIVTGDSGNGLTHGTIAGMLICDLILGKENAWADIYSPSRLKRKGFLTFLKEFTGGLMEYIKTNPGHVASVKISSILPGTAEVAEIDGNKYGVYKDVNNELHMVSAECTHLKCTIRWNNDEKTWDCPCHGSRFTYTGNVINGPANSNLDYYTDTDQLKK